LHVAAIIQARMTSTRFPGKVLAPLVGKPVLWHIVHRLRQCKTVNTIALAITTNSSDDPLKEFAFSEGIKVIRGPEKNVLARYYLAAKEIRADVIVRVTGDVPLVDPEWLDMLVNTLLEQEVDWVGSAPSIPCIHEGYSPFTFHALEKLVKEAGEDPVAREHLTAYFKKNPGFISFAEIIPEPEYRFEGARLSIDTPADLRFIEELYRRLQVPAGEADVRAVVNMLRKEPDLLKFNTHVYQKKADDSTRQVLFRCDGSARLGYGHLIRCLALADEMRAGYGCGIIFAIAPEKESLAILRKAGYRIEVIGNESEEEFLSRLVAEINPDAVVFDNLIELDRQVLDRWRQRGIIIVAIDDPTSKRLAADLVFYPPVPQVNKMNWRGFCGELFSGWQWVILRREFFARYNGSPGQGKDKTLVVVTMGGSDPKGLTLKAVEALEVLGEDFDTSILLGPGFSYDNALQSLLRTSSRQYNVFRNHDDVSGLFAKADLAVASFGVTAYELAASGVPSILLCISEDHVLSASAFEAAGIGLNLGLSNDIETERIGQAVRNLINNRQLRDNMSAKARSLVDGKGVQRIAEVIVSRLRHSR